MAPPIRATPRVLLSTMAERSPPFSRGRARGGVAVGGSMAESSQNQGDRAEPIDPMSEVSADSWPEGHGSSLPAADLEGAQNEGAQDELVGIETGAYTLVELIGSGAMGRVYRAQKRGLQRQRAVKVLRASDGPGEGLLHEAIDHPNVVSVEDIGTVRDRAGNTRPFIVMELLGAGAALDRWIAAHQPSLDERLRLVEEAARGVAHAHSLGVLHHDLKPANILVDRYGRAKVSDFGLAQLRIEAGRGLTGGTRAFQSPEQCAMSAEELDERSDVYALGATLFTVLTDGAVPVAISAMVTREEAHRLKVEHPPLLQLLPSGTPSSLVSILTRSLAPKREDRFASVREFADAIAAVRADGRSAVGRLRSAMLGWIQRRPRAASWVLGIAIGLLAALVLSVPLRHLRPFESWYLAQLPAIDAGQVTTFEDVRIVRMPLGFEMASLSAQLDVPGVQVSPKRAWRPMHGAFVEAMSQAGAKVVAFDIFFPQAWPELDEPFAAAIRRSTDRGVPVVLGANSWIVDSADRPVMPEEFLAAGAHWGSLVIDLADSLPLIPLIAQPTEGEALPGFALATYAAAHQPLSRSSAWVKGNGVRMQFWKPIESAGRRQRTGVEGLLPAFKIQPTTNLPEFYWAGRESDWLMAYTQRATFPIAAIDDATLQYASLMLSTPEERAALVGGKTLIVVDPVDDSRFDLGMERELLGGEILAGAVQSLTSGRASRWMSGTSALMLCVPILALASLIGIVGSAKSQRPSVRWLVRAARLALLVLAIVGLWFLLLGVYRWFGLITLPIFWLLVIVAATGGSWITLSAIQDPRRGLLYLARLRRRGSDRASGVITS